MGYIDQPTKTINIVPAQGVTTQLAAHRTLIVGRMLTGSATADELYRDVPSSDTEINALFGVKSHIAGMIRAFKEINKVSPLDAYAFSDGGSPALADITFTNSATSDSIITVTAGSAYKYSVVLDVASGTAPADIATALIAAFNDVIDDAPFSASSGGSGIVDFTASNGGTIPNANWDIKIDGSIPGVNITPTAWASGATDPSTPGTIVADAIAGIRYQTVVWPVSYAAVNIVDEMDSRFNVASGVMNGVMLQTKVDTLANAKTYVSGTPFNSQSFVVNWNQIINTASHKGGAVVEMPDIISSKMAALRALRLTDGANLTPYLSTVATAEQFGGIGRASLPYFNTIIPGITPASPAEFPPFEDIEEATGSGISVIGPNSAYNETIFGEMVTTYLTDSTGADDTSYKFLNTVDTISAIREFVVANCGRRYAQTKLTSGTLRPGYDMANEASIRAFLNELYDDLADQTLVQSGSAAKRDFNANLTITLDIGSGTATISMAPLLVTQLRAVVGTIAINFGG